MQNTYKVYVRADVNGYIIAVQSSAFIADTTNWIQIDEGTGDRYHHAQGNYFPTPLMSDNGAYLYKYIDGAVLETTAEERAAQIPLPAPAAPTLEERLQAAEDALIALALGGAADV